MEKVIEALMQFEPSCEQEEIDKKIFLDMARNHRNSLTRESLIGHFTASAFVINKDKNKVVCCFHNIYKSWGWLGGHNDGDDDFLNVAKKEVEEECGIKKLKLFGKGIFSLEALPVFSHIKKSKFVPHHIHLNVTYVFIASEKEKLRIKENENSNVAWLTFDELLSKATEELMKPIYTKIIDKIIKIEKKKTK